MHTPQLAPARRFRRRRLSPIPFAVSALVALVTVSALSAAPSCAPPAAR